MKKENVKTSKNLEDSKKEKLELVKKDKGNEDG